MFLTSAMSTKQKLIERTRRSVHRESNRPQGILHIPKAIQLRNRGLSCVDDVVNDTEVNTVMIINGEISTGHRSQRAWHVGREVSITWETLRFPFTIINKVGCSNKLEGHSMIRRESDHFIVLRDGRADHMGKGVAGRRSPQRKQVPYA